MEMEPRKICQSRHYSARQPFKMAERVGLNTGCHRAGPWESWGATGDQLRLSW